MYCSVKTSKIRVPKSLRIPTLTLTSCLSRRLSCARYNRVYRNSLEAVPIEAGMPEWEEMVVTLLGGDADPNVRGHSGMTAYGAAGAYYLGGMVEVLQRYRCADEGVRSP